MFKKPRQLKDVPLWDAERFARSTEPDGECIVWTGHRDRKGYGQFWLDGRAQWAHRVAYAIHHGRCPATTLDHTCDNPSCVRPEHLRPLSRSKNTAIGNQSR